VLVRGLPVLQLFASAPTETPGLPTVLFGPGLVTATPCQV
jgi:hypothetical protein